jgi:chaperonin GroES
MNITPIEDKVLVEPDAPATTSAGGLVTPDNARRIIVTGTVLSVGPGVAPKEGGPIIPIDVKPGERVLYERHMGTELMSGGRKVLLLAEQYIQAVLGPTTQVELPPPSPPPPQEDSMLGDDYSV